MTLYKVDYKYILYNVYQRDSQIIFFLQVSQVTGAPGPSGLAAGGTAARAGGGSVWVGRGRGRLTGMTVQEGRCSWHPAPGDSVLMEKSLMKVGFLLINLSTCLPLSVGTI